MLFDWELLDVCERVHQSWHIDDEDDDALETIYCKGEDCDSTTVSNGSQMCQAGRRTLTAFCVLSMWVPLEGFMRPSLGFH